MAKQGSQGILAAWSEFLRALASFLTKLIWTAILLVILAAVGRYLYLNADVIPTGLESPRMREVPPVEPDWDRIDSQICRALEPARDAAQAHASQAYAAWMKTLRQRVEADFLDWYFGYFNQQWLGLKGVYYWSVNQILDEQPNAAEAITAQIQTEFANRVLRPQIAQQRLERIAGETVGVYVRELRRHLAEIPGRYRIPRLEWEARLADIAVLSHNVEANRETGLSLKTLAASGAAGGAIAASQISQALEPAIAKIGTKVGAKAAGKTAGKAVGKLAAKTGAKMGAKTGGKFFGPIVGAVILVWDFWDHHRTEAENRPILRQNLFDYLEELRRSLEQETLAVVDVLGQGIMDSVEKSRNR